jgi:plastocyanin
MRRAPILVLALLLLPALTGLAAAPALGATVTVQVGQDSQGLPADQFNKADVTINPGDSVHWNWFGSYHSVTSGDPPGTANKQFDSGVQTTEGATFDRTFQHPGVYHYFCQIHYSLGMVGTVTVQGVDPKPTAAFTVSNSTPTTGQSVTFDASSSSTSDTDTIERYSWDFGDGTGTQTTTSPSISHMFSSAAMRTVTLTITDAGSATSDPVSHQVTVLPPPNSPPVARFSARPGSPLTGQVVHFDASASSDVDGDAIASYRWAFGDGTRLTITAPTVTHRFQHAGKVVVQLVVVDSAGKSSTPKSTVLHVSLPPPRITNLRLSKTKFCVQHSHSCRHPGTRITFDLSRASTLTLIVRTRTPGGRVVERHKLTGKAGANSLQFTGAGLAPGRYVLELTAAGGSAHTGFTVVRS